MYVFGISTYARARQARGQQCMLFSLGFRGHLYTCAKFWDVWMCCNDMFRVETTSVECTADLLSPQGSSFFSKHTISSRPVEGGSIQCLVDSPLKASPPFLPRRIVLGSCLVGLVAWNHSTDEYSAELLSSGNGNFTG